MILHTRYTFFDGLKCGQLLLHSIKAFLKDLFHCSSVYIHLMDPTCWTFHLWEHHEYVLSDIQHEGDLFILLRPWNRWYTSHVLLVIRPNAFYAHTSLKTLSTACCTSANSLTYAELAKIVTTSMLHHNPPMVYLMIWCKHIICSSCSLHTTSDLWQNLMRLLNDTCTLSRHKSQWRNSLSSILWRLWLLPHNSDFISQNYEFTVHQFWLFTFTVLLFTAHDSEFISYNATLYLYCTLSFVFIFVFCIYNHQFYISLCIYSIA